MQRTLLTNEFDSLCSTFIYILYTISVSISRIIWRGGVIFNINSVFIEERERERERGRERDRWKCWLIKEKYNNKKYCCVMVVNADCSSWSILLHRFYLVKIVKRKYSPLCFSLILFIQFQWTDWCSCTIIQLNGKEELCICIAFGKS